MLTSFNNTISFAARDRMINLAITNRLYVSIAWMFAWIALTLPLPHANAQPDFQQIPKERRHVFLLVGQSNMAGRGEVTADDKKPNDRVWMLNQQNHWVPAVDPMHFDKPAIVGVGPGRSFGQSIAQRHPEDVIFLVPCAVGGSPISSWQVGGYHAETKTHPYDDMMKRAKIALEFGTLKAIVWHQGESDANAELAPRYAAALKELMERFRRELSAPDVPILIGQLGQFTEWDMWRKMVDQAHQDLAKQMPRVAFVPSNGLTHKGDMIHFDAASAKELGRRYAEAYEQIIAGR